MILTNEQASLSKDFRRLLLPRLKFESVHNPVPYELFSFSFEISRKISENFTVIQIRFIHSFLPRGHAINHASNMTGTQHNFIATIVHYKIYHRSLSSVVYSIKVNTNTTIPPPTRKIVRSQLSRYSLFKIEQRKR